MARKPMEPMLTFLHLILFPKFNPPPPPTHPTGPCDACLKLHHQPTSTSQTGSSPSRTTLATSLPLAVIRNLSRVSTFRLNAVMGSSDMPNRSSTWPSGTWYTTKWWQSRTYIATMLMWWTGHTNPTTTTSCPNPPLTERNAMSRQWWSLSKKRGLPCLRMLAKHCIILWQKNSCQQTSEMTSWMLLQKENRREVSDVEKWEIQWENNKDQQQHT